MFVTVILPLNLDRILTYSVAENVQDKVVLGGRVMVSVGAKSVYTAIVIDILQTAPVEDVKYKDILSVIDLYPIIPYEQLKLWNWISDYYICSLGSVMMRFLPREFRIKGVIGDSSDIVYDNAREVSKYRAIKILRYDREEVEQLLSRKKKQKEAYLDIINFFEKDNIYSITIRQLNDIGYSNVVINQLAKSGIIEIVTMQDIEASRRNDGGINIIPDIEISLDSIEHRCVEELKDNYVTKRVSLLFNNSSCSTDNMLFSLVNSVVVGGGNVLIVTPDTVSCEKMAREIRNVFGERVLEYNSTLSEKKRYDSYNAIAASGGGLIVVGISNSVGLPFASLGLIVVINEHDRLHKEDTVPRFMARDCAVVLGNIYDCAVVLESRTPSLESYYNVQQGKYFLVKYDNGKGVFADRDIRIINKFDIDRAGRVGGYNNSDNRILSKYLLSAIERNIEDKKGTVLYKNSLGYSRYMICANCGYVPYCERCNTPTYYNKAEGVLVCPICRFSSKHLEHKCDRCDSDEVEYRGYGTENIENSVVEYVPQARVLRFDREKFKTQKSSREVIKEIDAFQWDVIVGTQMLLRDYGFTNIATSSIVDCDTILNSSDFRAEERCYQIAMHLMSISQELVIQSCKPDYQILKDISRRDYQDMYNNQIESRKSFDYPPFVRFVYISVRHSDELSVSSISSAVFEKLTKNIDASRISVSKPIVDKVKGKYIMSILVKIFPGDNVRQIKYYIRNCVNFFSSSKYFRSYRFDIDVDKQ